VAYTAKIIIEWQWPEGFISAMILGYSVLGMLSYLLVYPLRHDTQVPWRRIFSRWFFISLLPFSVLLYLAVYVRVADHGLTAPRYAGVIISVWLAGIALYFIFSKRKDIRVVPASLAFIALLFSFGPWGIYSVSLNSQYNRLTDYLEKYDRTAPPYEGKESIPDKDAREMRSVIRYLLNMDAQELLRTYHTDLPDSIWDVYTYNLADKLAENWEIPKPSNTVTSSANQLTWHLMSSEDYIFVDTTPFRFSNMVYFEKTNWKEEDKVLVEYQSKTLASLSLDSLLTQLPTPPESETYHPASEMIYLYAKPNGDTLTIWFRQLNWTEKDGEFNRFNNYSGLAWW
jgi:hypothetical protein